MAEMAFSGVHPANPSEGGDGKTSNVNDWTYQCERDRSRACPRATEGARSGKRRRASERCCRQGAGSLGTMGTACASIRCANATLNGSSLPYLWPLPHLLA